MINIPNPFVTVATPRNNSQVRFRSVGTRTNVFSPPPLAQSIAYKGATMHQFRHMKGPTKIKLTINNNDSVMEKRRVVLQDVFIKSIQTNDRSIELQSRFGSNLDCNPWRTSSTDVPPFEAPMAMEQAN